METSIPSSLPNPDPVPAGWPAPMGTDAMYGLMGEIIETHLPFTEADPFGLVVQTATMFGNVVGTGPHFMVENDRHALALQTVQVGESSKSRKGVATGRMLGMFRAVDSVWHEERILRGISTGEGLVQAIARSKPEAAGVEGKRAMLIETEFGGVLQKMGRNKNTLTSILRQAYDGENLEVLTRGDPLKASGGHVSLIGHVTLADLGYMKDIDLFNGYGNRNLWTCVRRSKLIPDGCPPPDAEMTPLTEKLRGAVSFAQSVKEVKMSTNARDLWEEIYVDLSRKVEGRVGAVTARGEAMTRRLSTIFALMNRSPEVRTKHLKAGLAVWTYCSDSAKFIFNQRKLIRADSLEDKIMELLTKSPDGLSRSEISAGLNNHFKKEEISGALTKLSDRGMVKVRKVAGTGGRPREIWSKVD